MLEPVNQAVTIKGEKWDVALYSQLTASPAERPAMAVMADLLAQGLAHVNALNWDDRVLCLVDEDGDVASFIAHRESKWTRKVQVSLGGTTPVWRGQGLYGALFHELVKVVRRDFPEAKGIESGYHVDNRASAAMHRSLNRQVTHHLTLFPL